MGVEGIPVIADHSIKSIKGGVTGANLLDKHYINVNADRDFTPTEYTDIRLVREGDFCANCDGVLKTFRGIELGHIFKLGAAQVITEMGG